MKKTILFFGILTSLLVCTSCNEQSKQGIQTFDLKNIVRKRSNNIRVSDSKVFGSQVLQITPEEGDKGIVIWEKGDRQNWSAGNYLVFEVYGNNEYSGVITIEFYKETKAGAEPEKIVLQSGEIAEADANRPWLLSLMGIQPRLKTKVVFPLSFLSAQTLFVPRSPRQLKGTITGNRLDPNDIARVMLRFGPFFDPYFRPNYEIAAISINDSLPEPFPATDPIIDKFGQRKDKDWPGKIKDEDDLIARNLALEKAVVSAQLPDDWSRYGGWKGKRFQATGYFRTHHDGSRWWFVDPDGYVFLSNGVCGIGYGSGGPITGIEDLFEWLPAEDDPVFSNVMTGAAGATNAGGARGTAGVRDTTGVRGVGGARGAAGVRDTTGVRGVAGASSRRSLNFYTTNMIRVFGRDWQDNWNTITVGLMKQLRFNTMAVGGNQEFRVKNKIPYVVTLRGFPSTATRVYRDFPDVFADEYLTNSIRFAAQLNDYKDDPYLIGYFLCNEPQWGFGYHNIAYEMFGTNQQSKTKDAFVKWLDEKYDNNIAALNKAWMLNLGGFDELKQMTFKEYPSQTADKDFYDFSVVMVQMYVNIPTDEVMKVDKNHLNMGMRYAWLSSDLLYKAGERFDVFSINGYGIDPPPTEEIARISGKPVIIGEFHHGAVDRALPATGIIGVLNQKDRADAYRNYIEQGFARPELIGMHYFQWIDQPFYGRGDGENYNIGVITTANLPYPELTEAMNITNERMYKVATGERAPFKADIVKIPPIHY